MPRLRFIQLIFALALLVPGAARAHGGEAHGAALGDWTFEPLALALLTASALIYATGQARMTPAQRRSIAPLPRILCYSCSVAVLIAALFSPIDDFADSSFAWHMLQHLLLMLVAAPLMAMSNMHLVALFALPMIPRRWIGRRINRAPGVKAGASDRLAPVVAATLFALGLWIWHAPHLYENALANEQLHTLEHLTFLMTAAVFWRMISTSGNRRLDAGTAILLVTLVGLQGNLLAALITLAPNPLYVSYASQPLADQQIAGLLMWVPAGLVYLGSTLVAIARLLKHVPPAHDTSIHRQP
ncbi:cytochrome c oxidase assembly protein [Novosphingobium sp. G106]|uniref:cytochrome c oxidase assembly protein n=1 Tax=Novosphingobium sp. G106 TaxID=2849500 RepID=UPI001C2D1CBC|nr:cytochrome c oxidase assembly protein [Novosphingobium sp. G106]MBV1691374.1 cytochrome c oxidase assembly protein [Novosphingobium sp. G106]